MSPKDFSDFSKDDLIKHIHQLEKRKKYGLVWDHERTKEKFDSEIANRLPVLVEDKELSITDEPDKPTHILIEGDNYYALSVLSFTHEKSVDVIYIDPPFNTGARDWKYNNDYVDMEDSYRHSKWLNMMYKRLRLAKDMLRHTGFLVCAIDENEVHNLRHLLDEIFGENNKVGMVTVLHNPKGRNQTKFFSENSEFMLVYAKDKEAAKFNKVVIDADKKASFDLSDEMGKYRLEPYMRARSNWARSARPNNYYPIYVSPDLADLTLEPIEGYTKVLPIAPGGKEYAWKIIKDHFEKRYDGNYFVPKAIDGDIQIFHKYREQQVFKNVWTEQKYQSEFHGTNVIKEIFGESVFNYPKSIHLVEDIILITCPKNGVVLDFFAGSGTTAHAVMELNSRDEGNRQCLLVTNNENNIMAEVCYPRVQRVMKGYEYTGKEKSLLFEKRLVLTQVNNGPEIMSEYTEMRAANSEKFDELKGELSDNTIRLWGVSNIEEWKDGLGGNLKFYRTDFIPADQTDANKELLTHRAVEMLCLRENTFQCIEETDAWQIYGSRNKYMGILFDQLSIPEFKLRLGDLDVKLVNINIYVFSLGDDSFSTEFADMGDRINVRSVPDAILRVYRRIYGD